MDENFLRRQIHELGEASKDLTLRIEKEEKRVPVAAAMIPEWADEYARMVVRRIAYKLALKRAIDMLAELGREADARRETYDRDELLNALRGLGASEGR